MAREWRAAAATLFSLKNVVIFAAGGVSLLAVMGIGGILFIQSGVFDTTASTPEPFAEAMLVHRVFIRSVEAHAKRITAPPTFTQGEVMAGFRDYDRSCAACHGAPGVPAAPWAHAMTASPPYLEDAARRWRPRELYWIVAHGAKMTAMPAWGEIRSPGQIWNLVAFLDALPYLTADDYARMRAANGMKRGARS